MKPWTGAERNTPGVTRWHLHYGCFGSEVPNRGPGHSWYTVTYPQFPVVDICPHCTDAQIKPEVRDEDDNHEAWRTPKPRPPTNWPLKVEKKKTTTNDPLPDNHMARENTASPRVIVIPLLLSRIEPRTLCMLGRHSTAELHPQPNLDEREERHLSRDKLCSSDQLHLLSDRKITGAPCALFLSSQLVTGTDRDVVLNVVLFKYPAFGKWNL